MSVKQSAGLLLYRFTDQHLQVMLVHPGGPFWKNKDEGAWSLPKGEFETGEDPLAAAVRELREETGANAGGPFRELLPVKQKAGKIVFAWAVEMDIDINKIISNTFEMEWPPKSGKMQAFPEIDRARWFSAAEARIKINASQCAFIDQLEGLLQSP